MSWSSSSASTDAYSSWRIDNSTGGTAVRLMHVEEEQGATVTAATSIDNRLIISSLVGVAANWISAGCKLWTFWSHKKISHAPHNFRYVKIKKPVPHFGPTQNLAPLDEDFVMNPIETIRHLEKLLKNPAYRARQLKKINRINRQLNLSLATFNEKTTRKRLSQCLKQKHKMIKSLRQQKSEQDRAVALMRQAQAVAENLLTQVTPEDQISQLKIEDRIEIVARNGDIYEILADGRVNKLLPDGKRQGLCIVPKDGPYPVADVILAKKALIEADSDKFEEIANKTTPFVYTR